jgi:hypothetical protein
MRYKVIHILDSCHFYAKVCHYHKDHEHINAKSYTDQGFLTEGEGSVQLTSSLR